MHDCVKCGEIAINGPLCDPCQSVQNIERGRREIERVQNLRTRVAAR